MTHADVKWEDQALSKKIEKREQRTDHIIDG
jgi:hypothetical protein